jgi:hypothetical protein
VKHLIAFIPIILFSYALCTHQLSQKTEEYEINGKSVEKIKFNLLFSKLKELAKTWYCAETNTGGRTGYDAVDEKGVLYQCVFISDSGNSKSIIRIKK